MQNRTIRNRISLLLNKILNLFFALCVCIVIFILLQIFCFASFHIPSDSMEPALKVGDNIIVNKLIMGARLFNVVAALNKEEITIRRLPDMSKVKRNDVLVFNFPYSRQSTDNITFDIMKYYVKRCIALPGDTLEIKDGFFKIRGLNIICGNVDSQKYISTLSEENSNGVAFRTYPWDEAIKWTVRDFGPLSVPAKKQIMKMDSINFILYHRLISWEQKKKLTVEDDVVYLGDSIIHSYQFKENYYFMAGDRLENSQDSRYWGLLPESYIVGKASFIWKSEDKATGKIHWNRIFKKIV